MQLQDSNTVTLSEPTVICIVKCFLERMLVNEPINLACRHHDCKAYLVYILIFAMHRQADKHACSLGVCKVEEHCNNSSMRRLLDN